MALMSSNLLSAFDALAPMCEVSAPLCLAAREGLLEPFQDLHAICTRIGLPQARAGDVERALMAGEEAGLFSKATHMRWRVLDIEKVSQIAPLLQGAQLYKLRIHRDIDVVDVVLTKPPAPSQVSLKLEEMLMSSRGFKDTKQLLPAISEKAEKSFTVMTPYLDSVGASIVLNLFELTPAPDKCLVLRTLKDGAEPPGLSGISSRLLELGVRVMNFKLDRLNAPGNETFHAKVVLADADAAYVGSSNMNQWSFEYSLELGLYVRGGAAARIATLIDAVKAVSSPM